MATGPTPWPKRGDGIGYSGYKHQKGEKVIAITYNNGRSIYHTLERVNTGREADHLLSISEPMACKEAHRFAVFSYLGTSSATFYKRREIERER
jgi:hypothetical protein